MVVAVILGKVCRVLGGEAIHALSVLSLVLLFRKETVRKMAEVHG